MNEKLLTAFQTYEEFPDGVLLVEKDSNVFIITINEEKYIVRQNIDQISFEEVNGNFNMISKVSFYDVIDDSLICCISNVHGSEKEKNDKYCIKHLHEYLGLSENEKVILGLSDVQELIKKEKQKSLKKN